MAIISEHIDRMTEIKDIHNSWLYCFTNPPELGTRVSLSHRQPNVTEERIVKITREKLPVGHRSTGRSRKRWRDNLSND